MRFCIAALFALLVCSAAFAADMTIKINPAGEPVLVSDEVLMPTGVTVSPEAASRYGLLALQAFKTPGEPVPVSVESEIRAEGWSLIATTRASAGVRYDAEAKTITVVGPYVVKTGAPRPNELFGFMACSMVLLFIALLMDQVEIFGLTLLALLSGEFFILLPIVVLTGAYEASVAAGVAMVAMLISLTVEQTKTRLRVLSLYVVALALSGFGMYFAWP